MNEISSETFELDKFQREVLRGIDSIQENDLSSISHLSDISQMRGVRRQPSRIKPRIEISGIDLSRMEKRQRIIRAIRKEISGKIIIFNTKNLESLLRDLELSEEEINQSIQFQVRSIEEKIEEQLELERKELYEYVGDFMNDFTYDISRSSDIVRTKILHKEKQEEQQILATKMLITEKILTRVCPALQSFSGDSHDIAKIIVPILIPLVLAGTLTIPLQPLIFSYIAILISRMGVASLCANYSKKPEK